MTDALDMEFQDLGVELLTEFGEVTNLISGRRTKDNITGVLSGTETPYTLQTAQIDFEEDSIDGTLILRGDAVLITNADGREPLKDDRVTIDSENWNILGVQKIRSKPNGRVAAYILLCRV